MENKYIEKECEGSCPNCKSININYHCGTVQDEAYVYEASCYDCDTEFTEEYILKYSVSVIQNN
jgi:hypothetical protein